MNNIEQDNALIAKGSHFWCKGHQSAQPIDDQSHNPEYCHGCYQLLKADRELDIKQAHKSEGWSKDTMAFITGGLKWGVTPTGGVCCYGPVESLEETPTLGKPPDKTSPNHNGSPPRREKAVTKLLQVETLGAGSPAIQTEVIMLQEKRHPGRPKKEKGEPVTRMTAWRHKKECQGVLI